MARGQVCRNAGKFLAGNQFSERLAPLDDQLRGIRLTPQHLIKLFAFYDILLVRGGFCPAEQSEDDCI